MALSSSSRTLYWAWNLKPPAHPLPACDVSHRCPHRLLQFLGLKTSSVFCGLNAHFCHRSMLSLVLRSEPIAIPRAQDSCKHLRPACPPRCVLALLLRLQRWCRSLVFCSCLTVPHSFCSFFNFCCLALFCSVCYCAHHAEKVCRISKLFVNKWFRHSCSVGNELFLYFCPATCVSRWNRHLDDFQTKSTQLRLVTL